MPTVRRLRPRSDASGLTHPLRVDRRTKNLTKRLRAGDIAVIDHADLDRVSAEALAACRPAAVINAARSTTGRYPNVGPQVLHDAGIPLVDGVGPEVMALHDGTIARLEGGTLLVEDRAVASGTLATQESIDRAMADAREGLSAQIEAFAMNTMEYVRRERELLLDGVGVPPIRTRIDGRHVLIVVRGHHYKEDLRTLRAYIREYKPILIGVDGGADALLDEGRTPDMIVGDMDSVSDKALTCGAEIVVHAYRNGDAPGVARVEALGVTPVVFPATGTSEDVAMLLADDCGASLIVAVGTHVTLEEFLDKGRPGMASTFLTRLRVGGKLVDAKGVSRLYRARISWMSLILLAIAGMAALTAALAATPGGQAVLQVVFGRWDDLWSWLARMLT